MRCDRVAARNAQTSNFMSTRLAYASNVRAGAIGFIYLKIEFWNGYECCWKTKEDKFPGHMVTTLTEIDIKFYFHAK